ncbi:MAG: insulinase family protein [Gammaproteobacteria bacterium]|nr:insulinase family protein [Gammaproteobacteria bacterium]
MLVKNNFFPLLLVVSFLALAGCATSSIKSIETTNHKAVDIKEWKTSNGVRVLYVYAPELPMVDVQVVFDAGSVRDGNKPGIAKLTGGMLSHGARLGNKNLSVDDISERFESIGAHFSSGSSKDNASISLRTLNDEKWFNKAVATMYAVINAPTFDKTELERVRKQLLISFEGRKQSPSTIANETFNKGLYKNHPYAMPGIGTVKSVKQLSRKDLIRFYKKYYVASNALVTIVGDLNRKKAESLAEKIVGKLPAGKKAKPLPVVEDLKSASSVHHEFPSTQTHIMIGQPGIHRKDKDYFTLYVANHILGGSGFGSRIMQEIREKRGLAYSSYSYFAPMLKRGPFVIGMQTSNGQTAEALNVLKETLTNYVDKGPTEKELLHAKKNITGGFPLRIDSNKDISGYLGMIGFYNLPLSYLKDFNQRIEAVTLAEIKETLKRRIVPDKMFTVTVGRRAN